MRRHISQSLKIGRRNINYLVVQRTQDSEKYAALEPACEKGSANNFWDLLKRWMSSQLLTFGL